MIKKDYKLYLDHSGMCMYKTDPDNHIAEALGLYLALYNVTTHHPSNTFYIYTDSDSVIKYVKPLYFAKDPDPRYKKPFPRWYLKDKLTPLQQQVCNIVDLIHFLENHRYVIKLKVVKSHCNNPYKQIEYQKQFNENITLEEARYICVGNSCIDSFLKDIARDERISDYLIKIDPVPYMK